MWPVHVLLPKKNFYQIALKTCGLETNSIPLILSFFTYVTDLTKNWNYVYWLLLFLIWIKFGHTQIGVPKICLAMLKTVSINSWKYVKTFFFSRGFFTSISSSQTHSVLNLFSPLNTGQKFFKTKNIWLNYQFHVFCLIPWTKS